MRYRGFHALALGALSAMLVSGCNKPEAAKAPDAAAANVAAPGDAHAVTESGTPVDVDVNVEIPGVAGPGSRVNPAHAAEKTPEEPAKPAAEEAKGPQEWPDVPIFRALTDAVRKGATEAVAEPARDAPAEPPPGQKVP